MNDPSTFIKLDRKLLEWRWFQNPKTLSVWVWLLLSVNAFPKEYEKETIGRGEIATSYADIGKAVHQTVSEVRTALKHLKDTGEINVKATAKGQIIRVLGYDKYQGMVTAPAPEDEKEEEKKAGDAPKVPSLSEVAEYFAEKGLDEHDAIRFMEYNGKKGWKINGKPVRRWKAAADGWIRNKENMK